MADKLDLDDKACLDTVCDCWLAVCCVPIGSPNYVSGYECLICGDEECCKLLNETGQKQNIFINSPLLQKLRATDYYKKKVEERRKELQTITPLEKENQ